MRIRPGSDMRTCPSSERKEMAIVLAAHNVELREDEPEWPAMVLANFVLGASARSRLLERLRQKEGISYGAFSSINADPFDRNGMVFAGAICAPQNAQKAMASLTDEVRKLAASGVAEPELGESKKGWKLSYDGRLAQDDFVLSLLSRNLFVGRTYDFQKKIVERVLALSPKELSAATAKLITPSRLVQISAGSLKAKPGN